MKDLIEIDENNLDKECLRQPQLYMQFSKKAADARLEMDRARSFLEVVIAEASLKVRNNPSAYGIEKVTEAAIRESVLSMDSVKEATEAVNQARHRQEVYQGAITALEHKKRSLTLLVDLHGQGYFSSVRTTREGQEAVEEAQKKSVRRRPSRKE